MGLRAWTAYYVASAIASLSLGAGCASDVANRYYGDTQYAPKDVAEVELLHAAPSRPFDVIADFQSRNESPKSVQKKAAAIGADAVIVTTLGGRYSEAEEWANQKRDRELYTRIVGTAIKYKSLEAR